MGTDKSQSSKETRHRIQNYEQYFNKAATRRRSTPLRYFQKYVGGSLVYMAGGIPNDSLFPIIEADLKLRDGRTLKVSKDEMRVALQYGESAGLPSLIEWLIELQRRMHKPPTLPAPGVSPSANSDMEVITCNGSQEAMCKVMETMLEEGDSLVMEEATYPATISIFEPLGCKGVPVKNDADGMVISELENIMSNWNEATSGRRPKLVYCVPVGANPTGANWTLERKKELYAVARKYEMLIIEDDPYFLLQFSEPLIPSILSLDDDGRVLRCDSFSKLLAPGSRIGYLSGPRQFTQKVIQWMETSSGSANVVSQTVIWKVLQAMGQDGFIEHGKKIAKFYHSRSKLLIAMAEKHLKGLAEWSAPAGGMFMWMKLLGVVDSQSVCHKLIQKGAVFVEGCFFRPVSADSPYIRISYSFASHEDMDKAFQWLAEILKETNKSRKK